jgi:hypothetical protein
LNNLRIHLFTSGQEVCQPSTKRERLGEAFATRTKSKRVFVTRKLLLKKIPSPQPTNVTLSSLKDKKDRRITSRKRHLSHSGVMHTSAVESSLTHLLMASEI